MVTFKCVLLRTFELAMFPNEEACCNAKEGKTVALIEVWNS